MSAIFGEILRFGQPDGPDIQLIVTVMSFMRGTKPLTVTPLCMTATGGCIATLCSFTAR